MESPEEEKKAAQRARRKQYYLDNREAILAYAHKRLQEKKEQIAAYEKMRRERDREKRRAYTRKWELENPDKRRAKGRRSTLHNGRKYRLSKRHGISLDEYADLYRQQQGLCLICNTYHKVLAVDHSHAKGHFRGLLCKNCNSGLGFFYDNVESLQQAIYYLRANEG